MPNKKQRRIILGMSGATGVYGALKTMQVMNDLHPIEPHVIISGGFPAVLDVELKDKFLSDFCKDIGVSVFEGNLIINKKAEHYRKLEYLRLNINLHDNKNLGAPIASGSFETEGMIVLPCSMNTLSSIACGRADTLLTRAADVILKEKRKLVLCVRETPLSSIHLENMKRVADAGAFIMPICLPFYGGSLADSAYKYVNRYVARVMSYFRLYTNDLLTWKGV